MSALTDRNDAGTATETVFSGPYRLSTIGIVVLMTIIAFEAMAVATALPTAARDLHGLAFYGWAFTGFLVTSIIGMVVSGLYCDQRGARAPMIVGLVLFVCGLMVAGVAPTMWLLVLARVIQGLSVGLLITAMYVVMGETYPDHIRPKIFAALASAWIVPGLVGPVVAGWLTEQFSWRWVFAGLAPLVVIGGALMAPSVRRLRTGPAAGAGQPAERPDFARVAYAVLAAVGIAGIAAFGERPGWLTAVVAVVGAAAMVTGLRHLVPRGTATLRAGAPAAIAYRGILAGTFFGMEAIVPLTLTVQHHYSATASGLPLMLTAVTWAAGSWYQGHRDVDRSRLVAAGLVLMAIAGAGMATVALSWTPGWVAFVAWPIAGLGAGFALTSSSVVLLEFSSDADRGRNSSSLQLSDSSMSALCTAISGAFVATAAHHHLSYGTALATVFVLLAVAQLVAVSRASRLRSAASMDLTTLQAAREGVGAIGAPSGPLTP